MNELINILKNAEKANFTRQEILAIAAENGIDVKDAYSVINNKLNRVKRGVYTTETNKISITLILIHFIQAHK